MVVQIYKLFANYQIVCKLFYDYLQTFFYIIEKQRFMFNVRLIKKIGTMGFENAVTQISIDLEVSKGSVSSYLNGNIKASKNFLTKFANHYKVEQEEITDPKQKPDNIEVKDSFEQWSVPNKNGNEISNMPDGSFLMKVPLIPVKAYARYISEGDSAEFLEEMEYVYFNVDHVGKGKYRAFVIRGDSFWNEGGYDTPDKAIALGREVDKSHWRDGFRDSQLGWLIVTKNNIVLKDIVDQDLVNGIITCHSRNPSPEYSDFTLSLDEDVKSIWRVIKRQF